MRGIEPCWLLMPQRFSPHFKHKESFRLTIVSFCFFTEKRRETVRLRKVRVYFNDKTSPISYLFSVSDQRPSSRWKPLSNGYTSQGDVASFKLAEKYVQLFSWWKNEWIVFFLLLLLYYYLMVFTQLLCCVSCFSLFSESYPDSGRWITFRGGVFGAKNCRFCWLGYLVFAK